MWEISATHTPGLHRLHTVVARPTLGPGLRRPFNTIALMIWVVAGEVAVRVESACNMAAEPLEFLPVTHDACVNLSRLGYFFWKSVICIRDWDLKKKVDVGRSVWRLYGLTQRVNCVHVLDSPTRVSNHVCRLWKLYICVYLFDSPTRVLNSFCHL